MATQKYRSRLDATVGENKASPTKVAGRGPVRYKDGTENATPAPVKQVDALSIARSTSWGHSLGDPGDNPGKNGYGGASSINPGERAGKATVAPQAPTDNVLDALISGGIAALDKGDDWQTRQLDDEGDKNHGTSPVHPSFAKRGPASGSPGGVIPTKNGSPTSDWAQRRAQQLKEAK